MNLQAQATVFLDNLSQYAVQLAVPLQQLAVASLGAIGNLLLVVVLSLYMGSEPGSQGGRSGSQGGQGGQPRDDQGQFTDNPGRGNQNQFSGNPGRGHHGEGNMVCT